MQKKLYLTAAIYYYYYLLHHILLRLYYKFPLKSNHILKLFTAKLEMGPRHKVHIPAWVWTFLKFSFIRRQRLTLLLLADGRDGQGWLCAAVPQLGARIGAPEMLLHRADLAWWQPRQGCTLWCVHVHALRPRDREIRNKILAPYMFCTQVCPMKWVWETSQTSRNPAEPSEASPGCLNFSFLTSYHPALHRLGNSPSARHQQCRREVPMWLFLREQLLLRWVNLHRLTPWAELRAHKGGIKTIKVTSLIHTRTFL